MSTRSNVLFKQGTQAFQLYVHYDGYPSGRLSELLDFVKWNSDRNTDLSYTVANYIFYNKMLGELRNLDSIAKNEIPKYSDIEKIDTEKPITKYFESGIGKTGIGLIDVRLPNDPRFDALFIEWFYIVDLDKQTIEVLEPRYETKGDYATKDREYIPKEPKKQGVFNFDCVLTDEQYEKLDQGKRIAKKELIA